MSDCKHKLEFYWINGGGVIDDELYVNCTICQKDMSHREDLKDYAIISKADLEELKGFACPDVYEGFKGCGDCIVCRIKGDL